MGFKFDPRSENHNISREMMKRLSILKDSLPESIYNDAYEEIKKIGDRKVDNLWSIASLSQKFSGKEKDEILKEFLKGKTIDKADLPYARLKDDLTLGQLLTIGLSWDGVFDFSNEDQLLRAKQYAERSFI